MGFVVLGQYAEKAVHGHMVPADRDESYVPSRSETKTSAALQRHRANWRWQGGPFYVRAGKRLPPKRTQNAGRFEGGGLTR